MDVDMGHVYLIRLRQLRELIKPISSFTCPSTFGEATARIKHNLSYFGFTYAMFVLLIINLSSLLLPDLAVVFSANYLMWLLIYFFHDDPFVVFNRTVDDSIILRVLGVFNVLLFLSTFVPLNLLVPILIASAVAVIHATFRGTEDLPSELQEVGGDAELSETQEVGGDGDLISWDLQTQP
ncbi:hypothetical protein FNV43_RR23299 [Rhamnella rubrinervis]|uniref:PRA1 family protein n=1 Tax=Rhamnella rubrinervis TaxID=2594499 RepID=A0A8K0E3I8_9ROSA|nr:hypothetical protein FNV43_RR23299 [Rhamnella rubrinervis]